MENRKKIEALWAEHMRCEFELHDAEATMETMTKHPVINNIPTMIGGNGYEEVYHFYKYHFIPKLPKQLEIKTLSRTIDNERLVDEQLFRFVHDTPIDFMLPNIAPTGKIVAVPLIVIVYVENNKVAREHIYWDQATVLKQLGLLNEDTLPILGIEEANKMSDPSLPSNKLLNKC